jgi:hypothetical protein
MEEKKSLLKDQQFLLGVFGTFAVVVAIGLIVVSIAYFNLAKKSGSVAGVSDTQTAGNQVADNNANQGNQQQPATQVPQSSKPKVELFVMSYCPYGTQIEKGMIPVVQKLGDKIDFSIKFVFYSMHGQKEILENLNQYCIQRDQNSKYLTYLGCFLGSSDGASCLASSGIDTTKLTSCTQSVDAQYNVSKNFADESTWVSGQYPKFDVNLADNTKYNVQGSPTLIINGVESQAGRDSASLLAAVCGAFSNKPAECGAQLSSATPAPGFGSGTAQAGAPAAGCATPTN